MICGCQAFRCAIPTRCPHALVSNITIVTELTPSTVLRNCTRYRRLPLASPPAARRGSLEDGGQLPLLTFVTFLAFSALITLSALSDLITLLALAALITRSQTWLAPALAFTFTLQVVFAIALAIALRGDDRGTSS